MQVPRFMRQVNRAFTNRLMAPLAGLVPPLAIVHHTGRKSGRDHRTPILAYSVEGIYLTPLPYGTDTDWVLNLIEAGGGELEAAHARTRVENPRVVGTDDATLLMPELLGPAMQLLDLPGYLLLDPVEEAN